ncbi:MAG: prepilin-type N-terminal cleavage/methylation domain-containing protein [Verrucomicrobiae bacterium]|nr:prepilin-type N-terminal cleavage/methylation domain-containing protein [Verrucomicrobiae bacterium]
MNRRFEKSRRSSGYTLIEALVAGVVLMIGVSAASKLTLTLITQDEMNQRAATAMNYQETAVRLFQLGLDEADIRLLLPADPVVDSMTITTSSPSISLPGGSMTMESASIAVTYHPSPATQSWTANIWTSGDKNATRTTTITAFRSPLSNTVN